MHRHTHVLLAAFVGLAIVPACSRQMEERAEPQQTTSNTTVVPQRSDFELTTALQARLYSDDAIRGEDLDVTVDNGVATLSGTVMDEQAEQRALALARGVDGISSVEDRIDLAAGQIAGGQREPDARATTGTDTIAPGWITAKIQAQYFVDPDVKPWNIDVTTTAGGIVELRGEVDNAEARTEAVRIARATDGVTRVEDHLRVASTTADADATTEAADADVEAGERTAAHTPGGDTWITAKIQSKYFLDADVKGRDIDVTTQDGTVTLSGAVESERERRQAVAVARNTDGVRQVNDRLTVTPMERAADTARAPSAARGTSGNVAGAVDDTWITTKVQAQYFLDGDVKGHEVNVDTRNGVVTLTGSVESDAAKQLAESIARDTDGVSRVVNRLTVEVAR